jgi:hypothetical protein
MSGAVAPQILTLNYVVDTGFSRYVNVSFPYKVKINKIWFTADDTLAGDQVDERILALGGTKTRNAKYEGDAPSDWAPFFGGDDSIFSVNEDLKPFIWFGNPDARPEGAVTQYDDSWAGNYVNFRSTIGVPAPASTKNAIFGESSRDYAHVDATDAANDANNPYWYNWGWNGDYDAKKYKTDQSILNQDEFLSLFAYDNGGDWSGYDDNSAVVTIFVEYTVASGADDSSPTRIWD